MVSIGGVFLSFINPLGEIASEANKIKFLNLATLLYYALSVTVAYIALKFGCSVISAFILFTMFDVFFIVVINVIHKSFNIPVLQQLNTYFRAIIAVILGLIFGCFFWKINIEGLYGFIVKYILGETFALSVLLIIVLKSKCSHQITNKGSLGKIGDCMNADQGLVIVANDELQLGPLLTVDKEIIRM